MFRNKPCARRQAITLGSIILLLAVGSTITACGSIISGYIAGQARRGYEENANTFLQESARWTSDYQAFDKAWKDFRYQMKTSQAEKMNRMASLQNKESVDAFLGSLNQEQHTELVRLVMEGQRVETERKRLVRILASLTEEQKRVAETAAWARSVAMYESASFQRNQIMNGVANLQMQSQLRNY